MADYRVFSESAVFIDSKVVNDLAACSRADPILIALAREFHDRFNVRPLIVPSRETYFEGFFYPVHHLVVLGLAPR
jgi:hypothetical protein